MISNFGSRRTMNVELCHEIICFYLHLSFHCFTIFIKILTVIYTPSFCYSTFICMSPPKVAHSLYLYISPASKQSHFSLTVFLHVHSDAYSPLKLRHLQHLHGVRVLPGHSVFSLITYLLFSAWLWHVSNCCSTCSDIL